ncbi:alpha-D-ribose 1-methylphosphonate 5-triphosphate diphosphatase [Leptospira interrogans]
MRTCIRGDRVLLDGRLISSDLHLDYADGEGTIVDGRNASDADTVIDATGLLVLPGLVDIHGDAFERQIEPRPGVAFPLELALLETDRLLLSYGISTAYHGVTWSWEPGLRGTENALAMLETTERLRPNLGCDTRYHLRHETFNLDAEETIIDWLRAGRIGCLAFNDHMSGTIKDLERASKVARMVERTGLSFEAFNALVDRTYARRDDVPQSIARIAAAARGAGVTILSHDDRTESERAWFRELGARIAEFPMTETATQSAVAAGDVTVFGAPNVVRGGSHTGCPSAMDMVAAGWCSILASDYNYPTLLNAPFRIAAAGVLPIEEAWSLVSFNPAQALGLHDRGELAVGRRADVVLVDAEAVGGPVVVATIANGRIRYLTDAERICGTARSTSRIGNTMSA